MTSTNEHGQGRGYPSRAAVDLAAIRHNLGVLRAAAPGALQLATVKANAYGHGLLPVARAALDGGADWLGVAQLAEAFTLRRGLDEAGVARADAPILAWISTSSSDFAAAIEADIDLSVSWTWVLADICAAAREAGRPARVHVKIDTGMSRAGSTLADLPALASALRMAADDGLVEASAQREGLGQLGDAQPVGATVQGGAGDREESVPVGVRLDGRELERAGGGCAQDAQVVTDRGQVDGRG